MTAISGRFSLALLSIFFIALYSPTADAAPITGDEMLSDCTAYVNQSQQSSEDELVKQIECVYFINGILQGHAGASASGVGIIASTAGIPEKKRHELTEK